MTQTTTEHNTAVQSKTAIPSAEEKSWVGKTVAPKKAPSIEIDRPEKSKEPRNFLQKIAPKSKKGRVVFAACTAQVVSMALTTCAGYYFKQHRPKIVKDFEKSIVMRMNKISKNYKENYKVKYKGDEPKEGPALLSHKGWKGFLDYHDYQNLKRFSGFEYKNREGHKLTEKPNDSAKHYIQARTLTEFIAMGLTNIVSTITMRSYLDKKLDINLGGSKVFKTQMIDTMVGVGAMIGIPSISFLAKPTRDARLSIRNLVDKWPISAPPGSMEFIQKRKRRDSIGRSVSFAAMNVALPDFIGFVAGINATFRELDALEKEKNVDNKLEESESSGYGRG